MGSLYASGGQPATTFRCRDVPAPSGIPRRCRGGRISLVHQPKRRRYVAHLLYAPPIPRGDVLVLEDLVPVRGVTVELRVPEKISSAFTALPKKAAKLARSKGVVSVAGVTVSCHTMVVFRY